MKYVEVVLGFIGIAFTCMLLIISLTLEGIFRPPK